MPTWLSSLSALRFYMERSGFDAVGLVALTFVGMISIALLQTDGRYSYITV